MKNFLDYRPAHYVIGKTDKYVSYSVLNPKTLQMSVKKIKLNYIKSAKERREYAQKLIQRINYELANGFNPYTQNADFKVINISVAIKDFLLKKRRELETKSICNATFDDYKQQLQTFTNYLQTDIYLHELTENQIVNFLDYIFIDKKLTAYTRNHYLRTIKAFLNYCFSRKLITSNPAKNITNERKGKKKREPIPAEIITLIFNYLREINEKFYLLACWLLYGCFIRPSEICGLKIENINFANQTIFIPESISKNRKNQIVTIPQNIADYMIELKIWNYPQKYYIIGKNFRPSEKNISDKVLRAFWGKIRQKLKFSDTYQFYSLKDSGITRMINLLDIREVRDQARHSNIAITDVYTDRAKSNGNERIKHLDFSVEK